MTERESKEFYDDLRRKLQDYGSPPPESVWTGIRQQVPVRRRRWWPGALLGLVLVGFVAYLTVGPRLWRSETAGKRAVVASASTTEAGSSQTTRLDGEAPTSNQAARNATYAPTTTVPELVTSTPSEAQSSRESAVQSQAGSFRPNRGSGYNKPAFAEGAGIAKAPQRRLSTTPNDSALQQRPKAIAATTAKAAAASVPVSTLYKARRNRRPLPLAAVVSPRRAVRRPPATPDVAAAERNTLSPKANPELQPQLAASPIVSPVSVSTTTASTAFKAEVPAAFRLISLQMLPVGAPTVRPVAVDSVPVAHFRRWAVEVLAGPAVAYRRLGSADSTAGNQLPLLERPALTYAGQVQFRYAYTPRLSVATGLGYTRYATKFNFVLRKQAADTLPVTTEAIRRHDSYRYLALPLQVRYLLEQRGRWQYGVLGGGTLGLYLGGRTSSGTACACEQQRWIGANSPYRMVNLSLTGGVEVRYQVAPGWWVLAQPIFQYSIRNSNKPGTTGPARYPFATSLLTGISYNLR